ncbi:DUF6263 family protein [uncultured Polaribacter sp.]|jgi:hypothetical protein|uniref:DUF6263 family protein n=1 Tax=uncultured Polaribacter sp. TaxID=174711 RepID=UPI003704D2E8
MKKLLFLFVLVTTINATSQEYVLLRANYKKGDVLEVKMEQSQNMGAKGGVDMKMSMDMIVTSKDGDMLTTESKIKSINMNMLQGGMAMSYDSSMKVEDLDEMGKMMKQQFDPMMKSTIIAKVNNRGEILETKVEPSNPAMDQLTAQAKGIIYPNEEVSVGTSWSDVTSQQGMSVTSIYTVSKIENGKVYINITGAVTGMGEGDIKGDLVVDIETGIQDSASSEMAINAGGMDMKISTKTTTSKI